MNERLDWEKHRVGTILSLEYGKPLSDEKRVDEGSYPVYGANGIKGRTNDFYINKKSIIVGRKGSAGEINLTEEKFWPLDVTYFVTYDDKKYSLSFLFYLLNTLDLPSLAKGIKPGLNRNEVYNLEVCVPVLSEQNSITKLLEKKCTQIDSIINCEEKTIIELKEYKKSTIYKAVTKGISNAPLKDSSLSFIGKIPQNWGIIKIRNILVNKKGSVKVGPFGSQLAGSDFIDNGIPVYNQKTVISNDFVNGDAFISEKKFDDLKGFTLFPLEMVITTRGTIGKVAIAPKDLIKGVIHPCLIKFTPDRNKINMQYLSYIFNGSDVTTTQFFLENAATTIPVIYSDTLKNIIIPFPSLAEQEKIVSFLDEKCGQVDNLVEIKQQKISELKEYKKSLIYEYVTGKKEVSV